MNNPVNNQEKLGLVDNISTKHIEEAFLKAELEASKPAIEPDPKFPQPSINPQPDEPDVVDYVPTQLINGERTGVVRQEDQTFEQWEQQVIRQQREAFVNRTSIHMQPPRTSGYKPYVDLTEPSKPSADQVKRLRREQDIADIQQRLTLLKQAETKLRKDLDKNKQVQAVLHQRLEDLSSNSQK